MESRSSGWRPVPPQQSRARRRYFTLDPLSGVDGRKGREKITTLMWIVRKSYCFTHELRENLFDPSSDFQKPSDHCIHRSRENVITPLMDREKQPPFHSQITRKKKRISHGFRCGFS